MTELLSFVYTFIPAANGLAEIKFPAGFLVGLTGYGVGAVIVCVLRYISSVLSGGILWGSYAPEGMNPWVYSLVYNAGYMLPNAILTGVCAVLLCKALDPKTIRPMKRV